MSEEQSPITLRSALTPGQPAFSPAVRARLVWIAPLVSLLASGGIVAQSRARLERARTGLAAAETEMRELRTRYAALGGRIVVEHDHTTCDGNH